MVSATTLGLMADAYLGEVDRRSPTASPAVRGSDAGLPPLLVQVGSGELLLDDATRFAERAEAAGVDVTLELWDDVFHVWHSFADLLPEARDAIARIGAYVDQRLGAHREERHERPAVHRPVPPTAGRGGGRRDRPRAHHDAPVVEALAESGLNHLQVPKELGGLEADVDTTLDVLEEVAHQDGSIGWVYMANANATAMCSMFDPDVAREMLEGRPDVVCAGQFVSRGKARRVDGGFQVHGRFQFGSGIARATWVGGGALVRDADGNPERNDAGMPKVLAFVVPSDSVELTGNWDVMGLRGTGSFDYSIPEQFVEEGRSFWLFDDEPRCGGGVYRLGVVGFAGHRPRRLGARRGPPSARRDPGHPRLRPRPHRWRADAGRPGHPAGVQPAHARAALGPPARARHDREHRGSASMPVTR